MKPFYRCPCKHEFPESLGARGCPNCEGENEAKLITPTEDDGGDRVPRKRKGLTPAEEVFAQAVAGGMNQTSAYRRAYPASLSWKAASVQNKASAVARRVHVAARIADLVRQISAEFVVEKADLLRATAAIAFADPRRLVNEDGRLIPLDQLDATTAMAIASVEQDEFGRIKYKFWDKNSALERLFKHRGLFEKDNQQKVDALAALLGRASGKVLGPVHDAPHQLEGD